MIGPFAMLQDAALVRFLSTPGAGLQKLAVYHMVSRVRSLREEGEKVTNAAIARALGIDRTAASKAMSWLKKHGFIVVDKHGPKAVKLASVNLRDRVFGESKACTTRHASAEKACTTRHGLAQKRALQATVPASKACTVGHGAPLYRDTLKAAEEEGEGSNVVDFARRARQLRGLVVDVSADPSDTWLELRAKPHPDVRRVLEDEIGLQCMPEAHVVDERGRRRVGRYLWRPVADGSTERLTALRAAMKQLAPPTAVPTVVTASPTSTQSPAALAIASIAECWGGISAELDALVDELTREAAALDFPPDDLLDRCARVIADELGVGAGTPTQRIAAYRRQQHGLRAVAQ